MTTSIKAAAAAPVHMAMALTGESPFWDAATATLWWIDIQGQRILGFEPATGNTRRFAVPSMPGLIVGSRGGGLIIGLEDGLYAFDQTRGLGARIAAVEADNPATRINDGAVDPRGRIWFGTMDKTGSGAPVGSLYRLDTNGTLTAVREAVRVPNAISFSPDGRRFYFTDTPHQIIEAHDYDAERAELANMSAFARYSGEEKPDGACVDCDGALWIAIVGGARLEHRSAAGELIAVAELPVSRPTMPMLGGAHGATLFVTSQRRFLSADQLAREPLAGNLLALSVVRPAAAPFLAAF